MPGRSWTTREVAVVREHYPSGGAQACLPLLPGRTEGAIYLQAQKYKIRGPKLWKGRKPYETTDWIDAQIRRVYLEDHSRGAVSALSRHIERPRSWITRRAVQLGLVMGRHKHAPWSAGEIEILEEHAAKHPETIRRHLVAAGYNRSSHAVVTQLKRRKIDCTDPDVYSGRELARLMGIDVHTVRRYINDGLLRARRHKPMRSNEPGLIYEIRAKDVRDFIVRHTHHFDHRKCDKYWLIDILVPGHNKAGREVASGTTESAA